MYKHSVTDLVCIKKKNSTNGAKKTKMKKTGIWNTPITGIKRLCNDYSFKDNC